jgi:hypothetical protein
MSTMTCERAPKYRLRFEPLVAGERALELPCDEAGRVDLDALGDGERDAYFYARFVRRMRFAARIVRTDGP